jgi:hypothetical protein
MALAIPTTTRVRALAAPYWTAIGLTVASATAAALTLFMPGVLHGLAAMNGSARGTALVVLFIAVPMLVVSVIATALGGVRPAVSWLGVTAFLLYNSVLFLFATPFNALFLLYVAMFAFAFWTLVVLLRTVKVESFARHYARELPARPIAVFMGAIALLNAAAWLKSILPALPHSDSAEFLAGTGLTTNPIYVQDLSFWIPLMAVSAVLLWRRQAWGLVLVGGLLVQLVIESISIAVDQWMGSAADPASTVVSSALTPAFFALAAITLIPLYFYFRGMHRA